MMFPNDTNAHDAAVEALISASLHEPECEPEPTDEEISRYVEQKVTLSDEDEKALADSKAGLFDQIGRILHHDDQRTIAFPDAALELPSKGAASKEFIEALVIAKLTRLLSSPEYPLGRFRCQKFAYFSHRKADEDVTQSYMKKAAGPYSPWARYKGPETIALNNGYVAQAKSGSRNGFIPGINIGEIDRYISGRRICTAIEWVVGKFRYVKKEELELLATVDFAALELKDAAKPVSPDSIRQVLAENAEWAPKLDRAIFSEESIRRAMLQLRTLFPSTYDFMII